MKEIEVTNLTKFYALLLLYQGPRHGYELIKEIEEHTSKKPSTSQIYPLLTKLKENGLIEIEETGDREKKIYKLTGPGRKFVKKKFEMFGGIISATIEKDLTKCAHCGCEVYKGGYEEIIDGEKITFCCIHCAKSYKRE
ncbi:MAG: PadR family transcriptional regulator [Candidatus Hydrothermarchaeales archaeon]